ncbi:MAG: hypothetical protein ACFFFH_19460 [Candidatus Thorarchaeota archaeon]
MRFKSVTLIFLFILIVMLSGCTKPESSQETELVVLGVSGESREYTEEDLLELTNISGTSEYQNSLGNWREKGVYKGVPISIFAEEVGGIQPGDILIVTSSDNYSQVFSYNNIYPSTEWEEIQGPMILSYEMNGKRFSKWEDGLRIAFLPTDEQYSNEDQQLTSSLESSQEAASTRWVKWVKSLEFKREESITIIGENNHTLTSSQLRKLPSVIGSGRYLKSTGTIVGPFTYTGANISAVLELIIDISTNFSIDVISSDNYKFTYTKSQILGDVPLYNEEGVPIGHGGSGNLTLALAYEEGGAPLTKDIGGPFRMVYIGSNDPLTDGHFWSKYVDTIIIKEGIPDWSIKLSGLTVENIGQDDFDSIVYCGDHVHNLTYSYSEAGRIITYEGMPLWIALSIIDGGENELNHYVFNDFLAQKGYSVQIFSSDGSNLTLDSSITTRNDSLVLAHVKNKILLPEEEFPVKLVSPKLPKEKWIDNIISISITNISGFNMTWDVVLLNQINTSYSTTLTAEEYITIVSCPHHRRSITIKDEEDSVYVGIPLYVILAIFDGADIGSHYEGFDFSFNENLALDGYIVKVMANDGYSYDFESQLLINNTEIILAYLHNGLPLDSSLGPLRIIGSGLEEVQMVSAITEIQILLG